MSAADSAKDKQMAAFLKERGVQRTSGRCPWGCGTPISNGGEHLLSHLRNCLGSKRIKLIATQRRRGR